MRSTILLIFLAATGLQAQAERPNILWITVEDMSPALGCYGDPFAITPRLNQLATHSVRYTNAFATAPVCSPARSTLLTGMYATSLGTQRLRSEFPIPDSVHGFPSYLRQAGYYTSNNVKTDYNTAAHARLIAESWDESSEKAHWRNRPEGKPFFHVFNDMTTHQSRTMVWPYEQFQEQIQSQLTPERIHPPDQAPVPPYYPDTPTVRRTLARFADCVSAMDQHVGELLDQLAADGLADNTIVFFFSDHGSGLPRHKRNLHDTGTRVPLLVRFPPKWQHLAPAKPGETVDRLVSFVDFAPSVLSLLDIPAPAHFQGKPFLGKQMATAPEYVYGARDRVDEAFDLVRSVHDGRWLYLRNFMPHLAYNQPNGYSDQGEIQQIFREIQNPTEPQRAYAGDRKPVEELYDTAADPLCVTNLAAQPEHAAVLAKLRDEQRRWSLESRDVGFLPEDYAARLAKKGPLRDLPADFPFAEIRQAAELVGTGKLAEITACFASPNPAVRYWGAVALNAMGENAEPARETLQRALNDETASVRIEAASALLNLREVGLAGEQLDKELASENPVELLQACRAVELGLPFTSRSSLGTMRTLYQRSQTEKDDLWMFIGFSTKAYLDRALPASPR